MSISGDEKTWIGEELIRAQARCPEDKEQLKAVYQSVVKCLETGATQDQAFEPWFISSCLTQESTSFDSEKLEKILKELRIRFEAWGKLTEDQLPRQLTAEQTHEDKNEDDSHRLAGALPEFDLARLAAVSEATMSGKEELPSGLNPEDPTMALAFERMAAEDEQDEQELDGVPGLNVPLDSLEKDSEVNKRIVIMSKQTMEQAREFFELNPNSMPLTCAQNAGVAKADRLSVYVLAALSDPARPGFLLPRREAKDNLKLHVTGLLTNPRINLDAKLHPSKDPSKPKRYVSASFPLGGETGKTVVKIIPFTARPGAKKNVNYFDDRKKWVVAIKYTSSSVIGTGGYDGLDDEQIQLVKMFEAIKPGSIESPELLLTTVTTYESKGVDNLKEIEKALDTNKFPPAYDVYTDDLGHPRTTWEKIPTRELVYHAHPDIDGVPRIRERNGHENAQVAAIKLAVGFKNESLYDSARNAVMQSACHSCAFFQLDASHGMVVVRGDKARLQKDDNASWFSPMTTETVHVVAEGVNALGHKLKVRVSGRVVENIYFPDHATFAMHLNHIPRGFKMYAPSFKTHPDAIQWSKCRASLQDSQRQGRKVCHCVTTWYSNDLYALPSSVMVGQRMHEIPETEPNAFLTEEERKQIEKKITSVQTWSKEQLDVISQVKFKGGYLVIQAPAGNGKTEMLAIITALYVLAGHKVVYGCTTHNATNNAFNRLVKFFVKLGLESPRRAYQWSIELNYLHDRDVPEEVVTDLPLEKALKYDDPQYELHKSVRDSQHKAMRARRFAIKEDSMAEGVYQDFIIPGVSVMVPEHKPEDKTSDDYGYLYDGDNVGSARRRTNEQKLADRPQVDAVEKYVELSKKALSVKDLDEDDRKARDYYGKKLLRAEVSRQKVLCTTLSNISDVDYRNSFGKPEKSDSNPNSGFVFIFDEAPTATDADIITSIVSMVLPERQKEHFMGRDMIKLIILCGDNKQIKPFVHNLNHNEFVEQLKYPLSDRLINLGFPYSELRTHYRTLEYIMRILVNDIVYDGRLVSAPSTFLGNNPSRKLTPAQYEFLMKYLNVPKHPITARHLEESDQRLAREEMCHLHLIEFNGSEERVTATGSKVNMVNICGFWEFVVTACWDTGLFDPKDWTRLTPYARDHAMSKKEGLRRLAEWNEKNPTRLKTPDDLPNEDVADNFAGKEARFIWYDTTVVNYAGFLIDNQRVNTHLTRSRDLMFIVGSMNVTNDRALEYKRRNKDGDEYFAGATIERAIMKLVQKGLWTKISVDLEYAQSVSVAIKVKGFSADGKLQSGEADAQGDDTVDDANLAWGDGEPIAPPEITWTGGEPIAPPDETEVDDGEATAAPDETGSDDGEATAAPDETEVDNGGSTAAPVVMDWASVPFTEEPDPFAPVGKKGASTFTDTTTPSTGW